MAELERELRRLRRQLAQTERRLAAAELRGRIAQVDHDRRRVRVEIGKTADGRPVLSPWVPWTESSNGIYRVHVPAQVGDRVVLRSPSGVLGTSSTVVRESYDNGQPSPSKAADQVVRTIGNATETIKNGRHHIEVGDKCQVTIADDGIRMIVGQTILFMSEEHVEVSVGSRGWLLTAAEMAMTTRFRGQGGSRPAHYVSGLDSGGDAAVDGNNQVLI